MIDKEYKRNYQREWMRERREEWFKANGPCADCGSWEDLELDHNDRENKVTHKVWSWSKERREAELAKCVARCRKCHRAKTSAERKTWSTKSKELMRQDDLRKKIREVLMGIRPSITDVSQEDSRH